MIDTSDRIIAQSHLDLDARIRRRAHEIWQSHPDGNTALQDWLQAEHEILGGASEPAAQSRATVVGDAHTPDPDRIQGMGEA
jgi:Protein of unknown function (DUF2934)